MCAESILGCGKALVWLPHTSKIQLGLPVQAATGIPMFLVLQARCCSPYCSLACVLHAPVVLQQVQETVLPWTAGWHVTPERDAAL